jgi:hypothetical protein
MKLANKAGDIRDRVTDFGRKTVDNSTIPAKQLQALSTPQPQLSILAAIKISGAAHSAANKIHAAANYVRQTNVRGWLMTLRIF